MKTFTLLIFGICLGLIARGQVIVTELISSGGDSFENIAWSAGESITESFEQDGIILNHGFHAGEIIQETEVQGIHVDPEKLVVFPNPSSDNVKIVLDTRYNKNGYLHYTMINEIGQVVKKGKYPAETHILNIQDLPPGYYVLTIISNNEIVKSFKLIKK